MTIADRIKHLREIRNMTQIELANKIGIGKQLLYKYENGIITNIPSDRIAAIASALDTTPSYLMGWDEKKKDPTPEMSGRTKEFAELFTRLNESQQLMVLGLLKELLAKDE